MILVAVSNPANLVSWQQHERTMKALHEASARLPEAAFVVKLHRADRAEHWRASRPPHSKLHVLDEAEARGTTIMDWIGAASVLATGASTSAVEAMVAGIPVVTMDFCDELGGTDFIRAGATTHVTEAAALEPALRSLLASGPSDDTRACAAHYLLSFFGPRDGRAAERCADAIDALRRCNEQTAGAARSYAGLAL